MFRDIRHYATSNFGELKRWTNDITEDQHLATTKGLFFVYAYGIYEEIVRQVVIKTINELNQSQTTVSQCINELYTLVFSSEYDSLYNAGNKIKWEKRWKISDKFIRNDIIHIPPELFPTDGKNIRYAQLQSIANSFGMKEDVLPSPDIEGYIQELVNNRNDIAHGNKLPKEVGRGYTKDDLKIKCEKISEVCTHIVDTYEKYIVEKKYLK